MRVAHLDDQLSPVTAASAFADTSGIGSACVLVTGASGRQSAQPHHRTPS